MARSIKQHGTKKAPRSVQRTPQRLMELYKLFARRGTDEEHDEADLLARLIQEAKALGENELASLAEAYRDAYVEDEATSINYYLLCEQLQEGEPPTLSHCLAGGGERSSAIPVRDIQKWKQAIAAIAAAWPGCDGIDWNWPEEWGPVAASIEDTAIRAMFVHQCEVVTRLGNTVGALEDHCEDVLANYKWCHACCALAEDFDRLRDA